MPSPFHISLFSLWLEKSSEEIFHCSIKSSASRNTRIFESEHHDSEVSTFLNSLIQALTEAVIIYTYPRLTVLPIRRIDLVKSTSVFSLWTAMTEKSHPSPLLYANFMLEKMHFEYIMDQQIVPDNRSINEIGWWTPRDFLTS